MIQQLHCWHLFKENKNPTSERYIEAHVHWSIIYNSSDMEKTYMSINGWMNKEDTHTQCNITNP